VAARHKHGLDRGWLAEFWDHHHHLKLGLLTDFLQPTTGCSSLAAWVNQARAPDICLVFDQVLLANGIHMGMLYIDILTFTRTVSSITW
jgi:hypothetical protein